MNSITPDMSPRFVSVETSDPEVLTEALQPVVPGVRAQPLRGATMHARVVLTKLLDVAMLSARFQNVHVSARDPRDYIGATTVLRGACRISDNIDAVDVHAGMSHFTEEHDEFDARMSEDTCEFMGVMVGGDRLASIADEVNRERSGEPSFRELLRSPGNAQHLAAHATEVWRWLREGGRFLESGASMEETADALVRSMAGDGGFENSGPGHTRGRRVAERATEYILESLGGPLTLTEIASSAGTSVRSLTRAFRRRYGTSPLQFIRARRLEAVRRALVVAEPGPATVTDAAMSFGFWHLGRFSASYREAFGESPSATLHRRRPPTHGHI